MGICDICNHECDTEDVLCTACREMIIRLAWICGCEPDLLTSAVAISATQTESAPAGDALEASAGWAE